MNKTVNTQAGYLPSSMLHAEFTSNLLILLVLCLILIALNGLILMVHTHSLGHTLRSMKESLNALNNTSIIFDRILKRREWKDHQHHLQNNGDVLEQVREKVADWALKNNIECG